MRSFNTGRKPPLLAILTEYADLPIVLDHVRIMHYKLSSKYVGSSNNCGSCGTVSSYCECVVANLRYGLVGIY